MDVVVAPAVGAIVPGYETARHLGARSIFVERENGQFALRRGFVIPAGARVVMVEDVITTGLSSRECLAAIAQEPGILLGAACLVDRSGGRADIGVERVSLLTLDIPNYPVDALPPRAGRHSGRQTRQPRPSAIGSIDMNRALRLGLNIDHVATVRNARGGRRPDPVRAALLAIEAGVDGITAHLREDRRHMIDHDVIRLKDLLTKPLNLEMAATPEMVRFAVDLRPHAVCLVPEKREERTTEGGLDIVGHAESLRDPIKRLLDAGIRVSLFIEPTVSAIEAAARLDVPVVELHTGTWCHAFVDGAPTAAAEFSRVETAARRAEALGIECHAGHGLDFETAGLIAALPTIVELNIGHFIIGEAMMVGLPSAIATMLEAMSKGRSAGRPA